MSESSPDSNDKSAETGPAPEQASTEPRETPEVGLVDDDDLPEDLRPSEDNPLAQTPEQREEAEREKESTPKVEGMPDMGEPG